MKIHDDGIEFEHLSQPSRAIAGEKSKIRANKTSSFVSSNAKGDLRSVSNLSEIENLGKIAAKNLKNIFA